MRESIQPRTTPAAVSDDGRVYVDLAQLVACRYRARDFSFLPRQPVHSLLNGRHASRIRGRGLNFEELRTYRPGDDVRTIDWKVTARMRAPHTRVFTEERDRATWLLVDQRMSMFFGSRLNMKSVTAAEAAALAAWRVLGAGDRVGAMVFDDVHCHAISPRRSQETVMRVLKTIVDRNRALNADLDDDGGSAMLNRVLESALRRVHHDGLVVLISDFHGADDDTRALLRRIAAHNDVLCALVHDPAATTLPPSHDLRVSDGRLQVELQLSSGKVLRDLVAFTSDRLAGILDYRGEPGLTVLPLSSGEDTAAQVRRLLGARRGG